MKSVKLCIMATAPVSIVSFYGKQLDYLKEQGFDVTVITSPDDNLVDKISKSCKLVLIPMSRRISPLKDIISFLRVAKVIKDGRFDIIQYSSPKAALLGSICGFLFSVPARLYLMWGIYYTGQTGLMKNLLKATERLTCLFSTHVSPDSKGNYRFAIDEGLCPASKMSVVGMGSANGVDLERFNPKRLKQKAEAVRKNFNIPKEAFVVGFVGRLCRDKGINELVEAFSMLSNDCDNMYLLLVGPREDKPNEYKGEVKLTLDRNKRIICVGHQDMPEEHMAAMDIFVLPSYREGFGIVNIEASAMELPVISTDIPGPRDSVINGKTGILVPAKAVEPLKQAIYRLYKDSNLRQGMGKAGREWAKNFKQEYIWQEIVKHRLSILKNSPKTLSDTLKRTLDVILALVFLFVSFPLIVVIGLLVLFNIGMPIFFIQPRPGYRERIFNIYKFRTMRDIQKGEEPVLSDAKRMTSFGRFIRMLSLDELPELFNVLRGDMSIVGPRPLLAQYISRYSQEQSRRHEVKPGITGWAQINGRNALSWQDRLCLDTWYVDNRSIWLDLKIICLTIYKVIKRQGINQPGQVTCEEFMGKEKT
jgi:lipopolysaccharide/colanic/teichoic acid biosynthesis glycosyltransferase